MDRDTTPCRGKINATRAVAVADSAPVELSPQNGNYLLRQFTNFSAAIIFLVANPDETAADGIPVLPYGVFTDDFSQSRWMAICGTGDTADVRVLEVLE